MSAGVIVPPAAPPLVIAGVPPLEEANTPVAGSSGMVSDSMHRHETRASVTGHTTNTDGTATITFTRLFPLLKPGLTLAFEEASDNGAIAWKVVSWTSTGTGPTLVYTAVTIKAYRFRALPIMDAVAGLLTQVITGVNTLISALTGFRVDGGTVGAIPFTCIAVKRTDGG